MFLRHAALFEWDDVPARPLITRADMPHRIQRVPRFIPAHQLDPVMERIRALECPLQRCALLTARWSGARRTEIRKLHLDCLDAYPDGTPRGCGWPPASPCASAPSPCTRKPPRQSATW